MSIALGTRDPRDIDFRLKQSFNGRTFSKPTAALATIAGKQ